MNGKYKGTIIEESLSDKSVIDELEVTHTYTEEDQDNPERTWHLYTVLVSKDEISKIQMYLKREDGWYAHFWDGDDVVVVFRDKMFKIKASDKSTWKNAIEYGLSVGVPLEQLDFLITED